MKYLYIILFVFSSLTFQQCTDLNIAPEDALPEEKAFDSASAYKSYLAKLYASFSLTGQDGPNGDGDISIVNDEGFTSYIRVYWKAQELTTDEAIIGWTDAGIRDLHAHSWSSENQFVRVLYYRIALIVSFANDFLKQSAPENLSLFDVPEEDWAEINEFRHEARFLRAMAYWHALDFFRNIPLETEISSNLPFQVSPMEVFNFIKSELSEIEDLLPAPRQNEYGRVDQAALWTLQAKMFLNAEVMVGENHYTECVGACNKILSAGYTLEENYFDLFKADNHNSNEIIFALNSDGKNSQNWGSTTFLVHGSVDNDILENIDLGISGGWGGMRTTSKMVQTMTNNDGSIDPRSNFYSNGHTLEIDDVGDFKQGYALLKYSNLTSQGTPGSDPTHVDTDYPLFRLADVYLMYAEAVLRGGAGGTTAEAVELVNQLKERSYKNDSYNITMSDLDLDFVLDERLKELHWEGTRRLDLIRYNQYTENGVWPWKGDIKEGRTTETFRNIFPIPASDLLANPNLNQNDGY